MKKFYALEVLLLVVVFAPAIVFAQVRQDWVAGYGGFGGDFGQVNCAGALAIETQEIPM